MNEQEIRATIAAIEVALGLRAIHTTDTIARTALYGALDHMRVELKAIQMLRAGA